MRVEWAPFLPSISKKGGPSPTSKKPVKPAVVVSLWRAECAASRIGVYEGLGSSELGVEVATAFAHKLASRAVPLVMPVHLRVAGISKRHRWGQEPYGGDISDSRRPGKQAGKLVGSVEDQKDHAQRSVELDGHEPGLRNRIDHTLEKM